MLHGGELRLEDNEPGLKATILLPARGGDGLAAQTPDVPPKAA